MTFALSYQDSAPFLLFRALADAVLYTIAREVRIPNLMSKDNPKY